MFKECCKQCRHVKFKGTMPKWPVQNQTHRTAQNTQNTKKIHVSYRNVSYLHVFVSICIVSFDSRIMHP